MVKGMNRRKFLKKAGIVLQSIGFAVLLAAETLIAPTLSATQQAAAIPRLGVLSNNPASTPATPSPSYEGFRQGLRDLGYVEQQNIIIEARWAEGRLDRLPALAAELVGLKVDVIVALGRVPAVAAMRVTTTIPIVMFAVVDPVTTGLVTNLERPGGNLTGLSAFDPHEATKQLQLLKETLPGLTRVAALGDQQIPEDAYRPYTDQAPALGVSLDILKVTGTAPDLERVFAEAKTERADALVVAEAPATVIHRRRIAELAIRDRLPTLFPRQAADAGGLIAYGTNIFEVTRRLAPYVDKILKGAKPGDLPVEVFVRHELIINVKTAQEIGVSIPPEVLKRADQIIH